MNFSYIFLRLALAVLCHFGLSFSFHTGPPGMLLGSFVARDAASSTPRATSSDINGWGTFDQLIDHANPSLGTFTQRFWYGTEYWKGPGSPVLLITPGEESATGFNKTYLTNDRITGLFAEAIGAAIVIIEHRYWGDSTPYANLSVENLQYLTLDNALRDTEYFARHFEPPFDTSGLSSPTEAPWILGGGSYAGALAAWEAAREASREKENATFWAFYSTSGVVEAINDLWQYFDIVRQATPANCSADLEAVVALVDEILDSGNEAAKQALKAKFLLEDLEDADFANALAMGPFLWQQTQFYSESYQGYNAYFRFCDYIANVWPNSTNEVPGSQGVGVSKALDGYAKWFTESKLPGYCEGSGYDDFRGEYNAGCLAYLNATNPMYTDLSSSNPFNRQWQWMLCNEPFGWFQDAAPDGRPSIISRYVNSTYRLHRCALMFPEDAGGFGLAQNRSPDEVNIATGGWSVSSNNSALQRLLHTNGQLDPWRPATVSADERPGGPLASSAEVPVHVLPGGVHCSDVYSENWAVNADSKAAADEQASTLSAWVDEYYLMKYIVRHL